MINLQVRQPLLVILYKVAIHYEVSATTFVNISQLKINKLSYKKFY